MKVRVHFLAAVVLSAVTVLAQGPLPVLDRVGINDLGIRPFGVYDGTMEKINLQNNNLNLSIPLVSLPGRAGHNLDLRLIYDSGFWRVNGSMWLAPPNGAQKRSKVKADELITNPQWVTGFAFEQQNPFVAIGWHLNWPTIQSNGPQVLYPKGDSQNQYTACVGTSIVILSDGSRHIFRNNAGCTASLGGDIVSEIPVMDSEDPDGAQLNHKDYGSDYVLTLRNGTKIYFPGFNTTGVMADKIVDANGNIISQQTTNSANVMTTVITDTVGRQVSIQWNYAPSQGSACSSGCSSSATYTDVNGTQETISFHFSPQSVSIPPENSGYQILYIIPQDPDYPYKNNLLDSVTINNSSAEPQTYSFAYDSNADLTQITYPHQGCTSYAYSMYPRLVVVPLAGADYTPLIVPMPGVSSKCVSPAGQCGPSCANAYLTQYIPNSSFTTALPANNENTKVVFPDGTSETHFFTQANMSQMESFHGITAQETEVDTASSTGSILKTVKTHWTGLHSWDLPDKITTFDGDIAAPQMVKRPTTILSSFVMSQASIQT
jgi:hypothetical protein